METKSKLIIENEPLATRTVRDGESDSSGQDSSGRKKVYLHPGQLYASSQPSTVTTILGSCVAVCLWDPVARAGGVNHYILPKWPGEGYVPRRYGDTAIQELLQQMQSAGAQARLLEAKVFGGACIFKGLQGSRDAHFGEQNIEIAKSALSSAGVKIVAQHVGGSRGRRVIFQTDTGTCWMKEL